MTSKAEQDVLAEKSELYAAGQAALDAMHEFWRIKERMGCGAAVCWLQDTDGRLLVFTRGEYKQQIMDVIDENNQDTIYFTEPI